MRLVPPLNPEGPEGPAKQGAGVTPSARHQSTMAGGSWSLSLPPLLPCMSTPRAGNRRGEEVKRQQRIGGTAATCRIIGFYEAERTQTERDGKHISDTMQLTTSSNELTH